MDNNEELKEIEEKEISIVSIKVRWKSNFFQNYKTNFKFYDIIMKEHLQK